MRKAIKILFFLLVFGSSSFSQARVIHNRIITRIFMDHSRFYFQVSSPVYCSGGRGRFYLKIDDPRVTMIQSQYLIGNKISLAVDSKCHNDGDTYAPVIYLENE